MATTSGVDLSRVHKIVSPLPFGQDGDFAINCYLVDSKPLTLIDTGIRGQVAVTAMEKGLAERGYRIEDLEQILVTHSHIDHYGSAAEFKRRSGARVVAHPLEKVHMETFPSGDSGYPDVIRRYFARWGVPEEMIERSIRGNSLMAGVREDVVVDAEVVDGSRVAIEDFELETVHVPGHCQGLVCYWNAKRKILFTGDHLLPNISPVPLMHLPLDAEAEKPKSLIQFLESLEKIERWPARIGLPSHGPEIPDIKGLIHSYRLHCERRQLKMLRILESGPKTPWEVGERYFPKRLEFEIYLVLSEVIGHMELLESRGRVERIEKDGRLYFRALESA